MEPASHPNVIKPTLLFRILLFSTFVYNNCYTYTSKRNSLKIHKRKSSSKVQKLANLLRADELVCSQCCRGMWTPTPHSILTFPPFCCVPSLCSPSQKQIRHPERQEVCVGKSHTFPSSLLWTSLPYAELLRGKIRDAVLLLHIIYRRGPTGHAQREEQICLKNI